MRADAEFDIIVYGASGFTGRLVAEYLAARFGTGGAVRPTNWCAVWGRPRSPTQAATG